MTVFPCKIHIYYSLIFHFPMTITQIRRRDGELIDFDRTRIEKAIELAASDIGEADRSFVKVITDFIVKDIEHVF